MLSLSRLQSIAKLKFNRISGFEGECLILDDLGGHLEIRLIGTHSISRLQMSVEKNQKKF